MCCSSRDCFTAAIAKILATTTASALVRLPLAQPRPVPRRPPLVPIRVQPQPACTYSMFTICACAGAASSNSCLHELPSYAGRAHEMRKMKPDFGSCEGPNRAVMRACCLLMGGVLGTLFVEMLWHAFFGCLHLAWDFCDSVGLAGRRGLATLVALFRGSRSERLALAVAVSHVSLFDGRLSRCAPYVES